MTPSILQMRSSIRTKHLALVLCSLLSLSGCAVYSVTLLPPRTVPKAAQQPLALSLSLAEVTGYSAGQQIVLNQKELKAMHERFSEAVKSMNIVREVLPMGEQADAYIEYTTRANLAGHPSILQALYKGVALIPSFFLPIPFPWDFGVEDTIRLKADVGGVSYTIREYEFKYTMSLWGFSMWAPIFSKNMLQRELTDYIVPVIANKVLRDYDFFKRYEQAVKSGDTEAIKKVLVVGQ